MQESEEILHCDVAGRLPLQLLGSQPRPPVETVRNILKAKAELQRHA